MSGLLLQADVEEIRNANEAMANSALRVLAMAYKECPEAPQQVTIGELEKRTHLHRLARHDRSCQT
ncbi:MAG: hypothetical protein MZV63_03025 [Marinilabiliales bacterium]|nr:hypothetical protein [Marinilabiliales bacterium]